MTYEFKPWDKPTGGKPVEIDVHEFEDSQLGRCVANGSHVAVPIIRADGRRVLLMQHSSTVLAAGDRVVQPESKTEPPPSEEMKRIAWQALREHQLRQLENAPPFDETDEDAGKSFARDRAAGDWFYRRTLPGGELLELKPLSYGNLILHLGKATPTGAPWVYDASWVFRDHDAAWRTVLGWNGEGDPEGWYRCYQTERRRPDGTIESEHFQP